MTTISGAESLRAAMSGAVLEPGDPGYDDARRTWSATVDHRPSVIARCATAADVAAAIGHARERGLEVSVRGGAHNALGLAVADGGLMIDLSTMHEVVVDPETRRARVGGGARLGDVDAATAAHGLAVPFGAISHTGVGGLTLGGGMGWLTRKFGMSIDNLVSAQVVTADGRVLRASADEHPELFWALRGGGGNFGVVTEFEFRLHPLDPMVEMALMFWPTDQGPAVLRLARDLVATLPPELNVITGAVHAPPAPFVPEQHRLTPGFAIVLAGFDGTPAHAEAVARIRAELPPLFDVVTPMPYVALQQLMDEGNAWGFYAHVKATFVEELSDEFIEVFTEQQARKGSPLSASLIYRLDGGYSAVGEDDTAFGGGRSPRFAVFLIGLAPDRELYAAERAWVRECWDALRPVAIGDGSGYVNDLIEVHDDQRVRAAYGAAKYERLARIKGEYDPDNVFHLNANIKPM